MRWRSVWTEARDFALEGMYLAVVVLVFLVILSRLLNSELGQSLSTMPVVGDGVAGLRELVGTTVNP